MGGRRLALDQGHNRIGLVVGHREAEHILFDFPPVVGQSHDARAARLAIGRTGQLLLEPGDTATVDRRDGCLLYTSPSPRD